MVVINWFSADNPARIKPALPYVKASELKIIEINF